MASAFSEGSSRAYYTGPSINVERLGSNSKVVAKIPVGNEPDWVGIDTSNDHIFVTNFLSAYVSVIDGATNKVIKNVTLFFELCCAVFDSKNGNVYVSDGVNGTVYVIDGKTNQVVGSFDIPGSFGATGIAYDSRNNYVYVSFFVSGNNKGNVSIIDASNDKVVGSVAVGLDPNAFYDPSNGYVYSANSGSDTVSVINGVKVIATVQVGSWPDAPDGFADGKVFVPNLNSGTISVIEGTKVVANISASVGVAGIGFDSHNHRLYVTNYYTDTVSLINPLTGKNVSAVDVGSEPYGPWFDASNNLVYVPCYGSNNVYVLS